MKVFSNSRELSTNERTEEEKRIKKLFCVGSRENFNSSTNLKPKKAF